MSILLFVMLGVFIFMMFRRNKKTQQQQAELQSKFGPGVEVMTSFGLFGRIAIAPAWTHLGYAIPSGVFAQEQLDLFDSGEEAASAGEWAAEGQ